MRSPKISVIMPCYNAERTVLRALDSLRLQTLKDLEVIAVNDGSTDGTRKILEQYRDNYPQFALKVFSKENEGVAECRNYGLKQVTGEYIGFLDADDEAEPEMYQQMTAAADRSGADIVAADFYWKNSRGERLQKEGPYQTGPDMMVHLFAVLWNKIYRTAFVMGTDVRFPYGDRYEDACFLYRLTQHVRTISFVDRPFVHYYQNEASITHTNDQQVKNMVDVFRIIVADYREKGNFEAYRDALEYIHIRFFLGNSFLRSARIADPRDRRQTILLGWDQLNDTFPNWRRNPYLRSEGGLKNRYYRLVNRGNLMFFAWLVRHLVPENL